MHLRRKKCLGKKSAWEPGSQVPAYYAGLLGQKQRHKCDSNTPKDPLRNSAGVKHLKRKGTFSKMDIKTVLSNFEGKVSPQSLMKGNHSCIIYLSPGLSSPQLLVDDSRQDRAGQKQCHQDLRPPETVLHFCRLATAAAVLPSSYAAYSHSVLSLDLGDHCHGRAGA